MRGREGREGADVAAIKASWCLGLIGSGAHSSQLYFSLMSQVSVSGSCKLAALSRSHYRLLLHTSPAHLLPSAPPLSVQRSVSSTRASLSVAHTAADTRAFSALVQRLQCVFLSGFCYFSFQCKRKMKGCGALSVCLPKQEKLLMNLSAEVLITGTARIRTHRHGKLHLPLSACCSIKAASAKLETKERESARSEGWWQRGRHVAEVLLLV